MYIHVTSTWNVRSVAQAIYLTSFVVVVDIGCRVRRCRCHIPRKMGPTSDTNPFFFGRSVCMCHLSRFNRLCTMFTDAVIHTAERARVYFLFSSISPESSDHFCVCVFFLLLSSCAILRSVWGNERRHKALRMWYAPVCTFIVAYIKIEKLLCKLQ